MKHRWAVGKLRAVPTNRSPLNEGQSTPDARELEGRRAIGASCYSIV